MRKSRFVRVLEQTVEVESRVEKTQQASSLVKLDAKVPQAKRDALVGTNTSEGEDLFVGYLGWAKAIGARGKAFHLV